MLQKVITKFTFIKSGLKFQLTLYIVILIIVPLVITSIVSYKVYRNSLLNETSNYSLKIVNQLNSNIDRYLEDMVSLSILPMYDKDLQNMLKNSDEGYDYINHGSIELYKQDKLHNFLFMLNNLRTEIDGVFIYGIDGKVFYNIRGKGIVGAGKINEKFNYKDSDWYKKAKIANGKSVIIETHLQDQVIASDKKVFSIAKIIKDINNGYDIGTILIDVDLSNIDEICKNVIYSSNERIIIFDKSGKIAYSSFDLSNKNIESISFDKMKDVNHGSFYAILFGEEYLITFSISQYSEWKTVRLVPVAQLLNVTTFIKKLTFFTSALCLIFAVIFLLFIANRISSPIHELKEKMRLVEKGDLNTKVEIKSKNEIGILGDGFNKMVVRLKELVHRVYEVQLQKKEAQLIALQNQINPHFLYNTLDSIHMIAEINGDYEASKMIITLSRLLRYSIKSGNDLVTVGDEVEHIKNYITIQQIRYENKFKLFIDIHENLLEYKILKLVLQPLVENCIYHGLKNKDVDCYILVSAEVVGDLISLKVTDNGAGMSVERLTKVINSIKNYDKNTEQKSIGISNVNNRIKTYFGEEFGLSVYSNTNVGTEIHLVIPAMKTVNREWTGCLTY